MDRQKELREQYKNREVVGGVYRIFNTNNDRHFLAASSNLAGSKNRYDFAVSTDMCLLPSMKEDWKLYGAASFTFEILEELEKKAEQTIREFESDLETLRALWQEKLGQPPSY